MPKFYMEVKVGGKWFAVAPTDGKRYEYDTPEKARAMLEVCYPDQCREKRLGGPIVVRVQGDPA